MVSLLEVAKDSNPTCIQAAARMPTPSYGITIHARWDHKRITAADLNAAITRAGGEVLSLDMARAVGPYISCDIRIDAESVEHGQKIVADISGLLGVEIVNVTDRTLVLHLGGKIETRNKVPVKSRADLSMAYTPGVARVCDQWSCYGSG